MTSARKECTACHGTGVPALVPMGTCVYCLGRGWVNALPPSGHAWKQSFLGLALDLDAPRPEQFEIEDMAHSLATMNRYSGHALWPMSVAQHSIKVAEIVAATDPSQALAALLHEGEEPWIGDWSSPLKWWLRHNAPEALSLIPPIKRACEIRFGLEPHALDSALIKHADLIMLATEKRDLFGPSPRDGWGASTGFALPEPLPEHCEEWTWREAKGRFLEAFERYGGKS